MFRLKVVGILCLVFALLGIAIHQKTSSFTESQTEKYLKTRLMSAHEMIKHLKTLQNFSIVAKSEILASLPSLKEKMALQATEDAWQSRHEQVFDLLKQQRDQLSEKQTGMQDQSNDIADWNIDVPYYMSVVDQNGLLIANVNYEKGFAKDATGDVDTQFLAKYPALAETLKGKSFFDIWQITDENLTVGVSPIRSQDMSQIIGAVIVGYKLKQNIDSLKRHLLADVAFLQGTEIKGNSSFDGSEELILSRRVGEIKQYFDGQMTQIKKPYHLTFDQSEYQLLMGELNGYQSAKHVGYLVAVSVSTDISEAKSISSYIDLMLVVGLFLLLMLFWVLYHQFMKPFYEIEHQVFDLAHDKEFNWLYIDEKSEFGDIAQNLNQVYAKLTGKDIPK
jgi:methyl-accepting chemotaxis protein